MRINQSPWDQNTKTHLCYRDGTKARFAKASENTWIQVGKALNPPHPFHILPKPIVISHPSFFPRCQIFPKVAPVRVQWHEIEHSPAGPTLASFYWYFKIHSKPDSHAMQQILDFHSVSDIYLLQLRPVHEHNYMSFGKQAWKVIINIMMMSTNINIITIIMNIIIIMEGWQWGAFVSWPLPE